jgi:hypothetical protein
MKGSNPKYATERLPDQTRQLTVHERLNGDAPAETQRYRHSQPFRKVSATPRLNLLRRRHTRTIQSTETDLNGHSFLCVNLNLAIYAYLLKIVMYGDAITNKKTDDNYFLKCIFFSFVTWIRFSGAFPGDRRIFIVAFGLKKIQYKSGVMH